MPERIIVVDDDPSVRSALSKGLSKRGYAVTEAASAEEALERVRATPFDLMLLDVKLPGMSGIEVIPHLKEIDSGLVIIVITGYGSKDVALEAIATGAYDYFSKPVSFRELEIIIRRALEKRKLQMEIRGLKERLIGVASERLIGQSETIRQVKSLIQRIAPLESTVLITGESGTGKELVADLLHFQSNRAAGPFVKLNCAAIPDGLLESELFGYEKGAFTGAQTQKPGKFELAQRGTILLDEVGDMPLAIQAKLLRVVEQKQIERLGGKRPLSIDARIIASTNQDLAELVGEKRFREDLYYRLNVAVIHLPALRERKEDLPLLIQHFLHEINPKLGTALTGVSKEAMEMLLSYQWPGNVRELANILERAAILSTGEVLTRAEIRRAFEKSPGIPPSPAPDEGISLRETLQEVERSLIISALKESEGVQSKAAKLLGLTPKNLWKKIQKHAIEVRGMIDGDG